MRKIYLLLFVFACIVYTTATAGTAEKRFDKYHFFAPFNVDQPADVTVCNGATTSTITFTSTVPGNTFTWTNNNSSIGLGASGSGNIAPFTATNTGTSPVVATITVTPTTGAPATFTITVNPTPTVNNVTNQTVCRNSPTIAVNFTGTLPNSIYNWTNSNTAIGLAATGSGNIGSFNAVNNTNAPITSTITVTPAVAQVFPELLYYKFDGAGNTSPNLASNPPAGTSNGTFAGTMFQGLSGSCGGALISQGVSSSQNYFNTGWVPNLTNSSWTLSFIAAGFPNSGVESVMGFFEGSSFLSLGYADFLGGFQLQYGTGSSDVLSANGSSGPAARTITFVYNNLANELRAYINGVLVNSKTGLTTPLNLIGTKFYIGNTFGPFSGGSSMQNGSSLDEVRLYSRALTVSEIQGLVNSCNSNNPCTGTSKTFTYTVYPDLVVNDPADQTICAGSATAAVNFTGTSGAVYNWTNNNPSIGLAASGTGNIPSFTPSFSGTAPVTATITVTPSFSGGPACTSSSQTFIITINPIPDVNNVASQTVCNNAATTAINFTGTVPGTNYTWTNSNPSIGLPANGSGNIPSFTALNTTGSPVTSTITVTPTFGSAVPDILYYKFDGAGTSVPNLASNPPAGTANATILGNASQGSSPVCGGAFIGGGNNGDVLNTNWQPNHSGSFTISFRNANLSATALSGIFNLPTSSGSLRLHGFINPGNGSNIIRLLGPTFANLDIPGGVSTSSVPKTVTIVYNSSTLVLDGYVDGVLVASVTALNPVNLTNSNSATMRIGMGETANIELTAGAFVDEFRLYGRMLSLTEIQDLATSCTPGAACTGSPEIFGITVNPSPVVNPVSSQNVCTGNNTTAINFTGNVAGATYNWTNSNSSIGLAANGTGNVASFTAINAGTTTQTATITVTPVDPASSCPGTPESFTISVSPVPTGTATPVSQTICSGSTISTISFTGNVPGITFDWTRDNLATVTGIPGVGAGNTISGTLTNTTNAPVTVTFTVTPSLGGCVGTPFTVTATVKESLPVATATPVSQTICSGNITPIVPSANYAGTTYSWTRDNTASVTGIAASGTGTISGTLFNTTTSPVTVTFTITPSFNGCDGAPITATVLVNAVPTITCPANIVTNNTLGVCGTTVNYNTTVTGAPTPTLTYALSGASTGNGNGNGSGSLFNVGITTVTVTATNICGSASCSFTVRVNDTENPTITCPANIQASTDAGICAATVATPNPVRADNCAVTKLTWTLSGATTGSSPATGINNVGTRLFNKGTTTVTYIVEDAAGNRASCSYTVTVRDFEVPVVICSPNITVTTQAGLCVAEVAYTVTASDNCPGVTTQLVSGPASGSAFPLGTTTITWMAIDAATNVSTNCSFTITVLDGQLPTISQQPVNRTVCAGSSATFSVTAATTPNAGGPIAYQWQQWSGLAWNNIAGATSSTYTINNVTLAMNTNTFRVVLTGLCTTVNSGSATLFVNPLPTISTNIASLSSIQPAQSTSIVATANPTGGSFVWRRNNTVLPGVTGATVSPITVDALGTYTATYTDLNGCVITSPTIVIAALPSDNMWVYPNPNNGVFQVRYYNEVAEPVNVLVYNAAGQLVYNKRTVTSDRYSRLDVDLGINTQGIYVVKIVTTSGKELAAKRIIVYR